METYQLLKALNGYSSHSRCGLVIMFHYVTADAYNMLRSLLMQPILPIQFTQHNTTFAFFEALG